ncbi:hypothetical protein [Aurantiacibacter spongiae]|uniref:Uncharacterized protein n=1 Tax=Aurantiacibacter spongiae TaxID=2488860 RepID=A0A3N5DSH4_9SPHN|nr:hypothetical protein [Aurantiacibacter spongiae]RPF72171.1 hypothetical protein EG799_11480 [Aurantiacibacter spongiae]
MNSVSPIAAAHATPSAEMGRAVPSRSLAMLLCFVPALYFLAITAYALFNFSSYGADLPRFLRYVAAPGLIAAALIWASRALAPRRAANIGLAATAILFALLLVELFLNARLIMAMMSLVSTLGTGGAQGDAAMRGQAGIPPMYTSKQLSNAMPVKRLDEAILGGVPGEEVLLCSHDGHPLYYTADRFGFNNDDAIYAKPIETMIVGDSFVEGHCQPRADTFVGRMRGLRPQTASIGMRAGGPLFELALLGRYGREFRPDWTVMAFFEGNDWQNLRKEAKTPWLAEALSPGARFGQPRPSPAQVERASAVIDEWWNKDVSPGVVFAKSSFVRNIFALNEVWGFLGLDYPRVTGDQPVYRDVLARAKSLSDEWGGRFILVYIPTDTRYRGLLDKSFTYDGLRDDVLEAAAANGVEVVDLTDIFARSDDPAALFAADGHFSPAGSQAAAEAVEERIEALTARRVASLR